MISLSFPKRGGGGELFKRHGAIIINILYLYGGEAIGIDTDVIDLAREVTSRFIATDSHEAGGIVEVASYCSRSTSWCAVDVETDVASIGGKC